MVRRAYRPEIPTPIIHLDRVHLIRFEGNVAAPASWRSVFCLRTRLVLISAAFPIHISIPTSASNRSNQRESFHIRTYREL